MNPHLSLNPISDVHQLLVYPFMVNALEAGTIVAVMASVAGWFMVLRRETLRRAHALGDVVPRRERRRARWAPARGRLLRLLRASRRS